MELGSKALLALAAAGILMGQTAEVRHDHLRKYGAGTLTVSADGIEFVEPGKPKHSRQWRWGDIQQLRLYPSKLQVLSYEDAKWRAYRDREVELTGLPEGFALSLIPLLREKLGPKVIIAMAETGEEPPLWEVPVKLQHRLGGSDGTLSYSPGRLVYSSPERGESRTWPISDVEVVSSAGPYELTLSTMERAGWTRGRKEFRFQLKEPLKASQYEALWWDVQKSQGLVTAVTGAPSGESK
jgi:hypothetical protein